MNFYNPYYYGNGNYQQVGTTQVYSGNTGSPSTAEVFQPIPEDSLFMKNLKSLPKEGLTISIERPTNQIALQESTTAPVAKRRGRKKKETSVTTTDKAEEVVTPEDSKRIVETTVYADSYSDTTNMTYGIIYQTDELINECKQELAYLKSQRTLKGKYNYINDTLNSMGTLLNTKLAAVKEINSTIKTINDNEYRRFKDFRSMNALDDNKAVMDAYSAFISAPVGVPEYHLPGTTNLTGGLNGVIQAGFPKGIQNNIDTGMANYMANLTPEENLMLQDNNKDIEEVIVYDQATGAKYFQWMNTRTGEVIPNMPISSELTIEDFTIDPRTRLAKNRNLNCIKKVIVLNEGAFGSY